MNTPPCVAPAPSSAGGSSSGTSPGAAGATTPSAQASLAAPMSRQARRASSASASTSRKADEPGDASTRSPLAGACTRARPAASSASQCCRSASVACGAQGQRLWVGLQPVCSHTPAGCCLLPQQPGPVSGSMLRRQSWGPWNSLHASCGARAESALQQDAEPFKRSPGPAAGLGDGRAGTAGAPPTSTRCRGATCASSVRTLRPSLRPSKSSVRTAARTATSASAVTTCARARRK